MSTDIVESHVEDATSLVPGDAFRRTIEQTDEHCGLSHSDEIRDRFVSHLGVQDDPTGDGKPQSWEALRGPSVSPAAFSRFLSQRTVGRYTLNLFCIIRGVVPVVYGFYWHFACII